ncbi:unnamed protein product [Symbiodinium sp. CCMP2456]|nr:unnamed protein product [Symbiodinium sp. CCMP2456]
MAEDSDMANATIAADEFNLFTKWWFYVLLFLGLYAFVVAVHLFIDYRQWESDRVKLMMEEAHAPYSFESSWRRPPPGSLRPREPSKRINERHSMGSTDLGAVLIFCS